MPMPMKVIVNLDSLYKLIYSNQENVLYPVGAEGNAVVDLLRFTGIFESQVLQTHWMTQRITCIATPKLVNENAQMFMHGIPVMQLDHLPHFRETGVFIVAAPPQQREGIYQYLTQFGCKNVFVIGDDVQKEVQSNLQNLYNSGRVMQWYANYFCNKLDEMRYRIDEQNEVCAVNSKTFEPYRNRFRGRKIVIFATGPSAQYYKPIPDAIHVGINYAWRREDVPLDYLFTIDKQPQNQDMEQGFDRVFQDIFVGKFVGRIPWGWVSCPEDISLRWKNVHRFFGEDSSNGFIYQDICYHALVLNSTIVFPAIQFALFTYPKEIYIVGCDLGSIYEHFYDQEQKNKPAIPFPAGDRVKLTWARIKMFARRYYPETKIISVNPVGLKGLFQDMYTEKLPPPIVN